MAIFPVILVNNATGSDTNTSGAGPGTAKTGTAATSTSTTNIDITDTVDLSGVATDGSAAIYFNDTTAGHRRFAQITNVTGGPSGSTWHITVDSTGVTSGVGPVTWAIGGVRASIGNATSALLLDNNGSSGDGLPGWAVEMQSGHTETITAQLALRRAGSSTVGRFILRGTSGAAVRPVVTFNNNSSCFAPAANYITMQDFDIVNSNVTKNNSVAINGFSCNGLRLIGLRIGTQSKAFWKGMAILAIYDQAQIISCEIAYCASVGATISTSALIMNCWIHDNGSHGIQDSATITWNIIGNLIVNNAGDGVNAGGSVGLNARSYILRNNTINNNTGSALNWTSNDSSMGGVSIQNNIFSNNGTYGLNFSGASVTTGTLSCYGVEILNNDFFNNTSGDSNLTLGSLNQNNPGLDPQYVNAAGANYAIGTNLRAKGYPTGGTLVIGSDSNTYSYLDVGASQHQDSGGGPIGKIINVPASSVY